MFFSADSNNPEGIDVQNVADALTLILEVRPDANSVFQSIQVILDDMYQADICAVETNQCVCKRRICGLKRILEANDGVSRHDSLITQFHEFIDVCETSAAVLAWWDIDGVTAITSIPYNLFLVPQSNEKPATHFAYPPGVGYGDLALQGQRLNLIQIYCHVLFSYCPDEEPTGATVLRAIPWPHQRYQIASGEQLNAK